MKLVLNAAQVAVLRPWFERRGLTLWDTAVGHVSIADGSGGPRLIWTDAEGLGNEDYLDDGQWHEIQRLLKMAVPRR